MSPLAVKTRRRIVCRKSSKNYPKGVAYRLLQSVFPDVALNDARKKLKDEGSISAGGEKGPVTLKPKAA